MSVQLKPWPPRRQPGRPAAPPSAGDFDMEEEVPLAPTPKRLAAPYRPTPSIRPTMSANARPTTRFGSPVGATAAVRPHQRPPQQYARPPSHPPPSSNSNIPFFMGAASRKRQMELSGGVPPDAASGHGYAGYEQPSGYSPSPRPSSFKPTPRPPAGPPPGRAAHGNSHPWQQGGSSQAWKGKPSKNSKPAAESPNPSLDTPVAWIQSLDEASSLVLQGFPAVGPVMHHDSNMQHLLSSANNILYDLIGDECGDVELKHDPEWEDYPEVGEALTTLGFGEVALCVAICPGRSIWAVGLASKQKHRQQAARLSLCVALAANADSLNDVVSKHDGFLQLCQSAGINTEDVVSAPAAASSWSGGRPKKKPKTYETEAEPFAESVQASPEEEALLAEQAEFEQEEEALLAEQAEFEQEVKAQEAEAEEAWQPKAKEKKPYVPETAMARDTALWMRLLEDIPEQLVAVSPEILVLASDGSGRKGLYSHADAVVAKLIGDNHQEEVEYVDDSDWSLFPAVGKALKNLGEKEECFVLASCPSRCLCAVGVGMKGKNRWAAAKVAIAVQVALQQVEIGEDLPDLSEFQAFADFIEEARAAKDYFASL